MTELHVDQASLGYQTTIIKKLSLEIPTGKIIGLIGPNGSGKSTLLKGLARIIQPSEGRILLDGVTIQKIATKEVAQKLAFLAQGTEANLSLTIKEVVSYGRYPYQKAFNQLSPKDYAVIDWALTATGLTELAERSVNDLSGGQRQRVWIALALAQDTDVLILDEPTTFLDPAHQLEILNLLKHINQEFGKTIIMSIHDLNQASRFCDQIYALKAGELLVSGTPQEVLTAENLANLFEIRVQLATFPDSEKPLILWYDLGGKTDEN